MPVSTIFIIDKYTGRQIRTIIFNKIKEFNKYIFFMASPKPDPALLISINFRPEPDPKMSGRAGPGRVRAEFENSTTQYGNHNISVLAIRI